MSALEILLIVAGIAVFIVSFIIPEKKEDSSQEMKTLAKEEVKNLVDSELDNVKERIEGTVDDTISSAVEKTERFMDRVSNEKIMSINEYSDTVLEQINKSHNEVMFLYDMLNEKTEYFKSTQASMNKTVKEARETSKHLEDVASEALAEKTSTETQKTAEKQEKASEEPKDFGVIANQESISFGDDFSDTGMDNRNEEILRLHKAGKSNVAIAKELDMGVGEVKLVIGLFEGGKK